MKRYDHRLSVRRAFVVWTLGLFFFLGPAWGTPLEELQKAFYFQAFESYAREMGFQTPALHLESVKPPPYAPNLSQEQWLERFVTAVIEQRQLRGAVADRFRADSQTLVRSPYSFGFFYRMPFVSKIDEAKRVVPHIKNVTKLRLPYHPPSEYKLNVTNYLSERFPTAMQDLLRRYRADVYLHSGDLNEALSMQAREGFTKAYRIDYDRGGPRKPYILVKKPDKNEYRLVIGNLFGKDVITQLSNKIGELRLPGNVYHVEHAQEAPVATLNEKGRSLDWSKVHRAVFGLSNTIFEALKKGGHWKREILTESGDEIDLVTNEDTGGQFILARYLHGDGMRILTQFLYDRGIREFTHVGTSGSLRDNARIGDLIIPEMVRSAEGQTFRIPNAFSGSDLFHGFRGNVFHDVHHGSAPALLSETRPYLEQQKAEGMESIDIEAQRLAPFFLARPDATFGEALVVSDIPLSTLTYDTHGATYHFIDDAISQVVTPLTNPLPRAHAAEAPSDAGCSALEGVAHHP